VRYLGKQNGGKLNQNPEDFKVDVTPDANSLRNYKDLTYTEHYALGEFIDNSITSALRQAVKLKSVDEDYSLRVSIKFDRDNNRLIIEDNAAGIGREMIGAALKTGRTATAGGIGLGRYGVGMKAAAFWWGSKLEIITHPIGEQSAWNVIVDISGSDDVEPLVDVKPITHSQTPGTTVIIHNLWKKIPANTTIDKIRAYLPSIYREYLGEQEHEGIKLKFSLDFEGKTLNYFSPNLLQAPFWPEKRKPPSGKVSKIWKQENISISLPSGVTVTGWVGILEKLNSELSGLVLKYKGKIVVGASALTEDGAIEDDNQTSFKPKKIFGQASSAVSRTIIGEFDMTLVGKTLTTNDVPWTDSDRDDFVDKLYSALTSGDEPILTMAKNFARRITSSAPKKDIADVQETDRKEGEIAKEAWDGNVNHEPERSSDGFLEPDSEIVDGDSIETSIRDNEGHEHTFKLSILAEQSRNFYELHSNENNHTVFVNMFHPLLAALDDTPEKRLILQRIFLSLSLAFVLDGSPDADSIIKKFNTVARKRGEESSSE
jgi:hypothetical protein